MGLNNTVTPKTITERDGVTQTSWITCAQAHWDAIRAVYGNTTPATVSAALETTQDGGDTWILDDITALSGGGSAPTNELKAGQLTIVVRDRNFYKIRIVLLEHSLYYTNHSANGLGIDAATDALINKLNGVTLTTKTGWFWQVGRSGEYFANTGAIAGVTADVNDKLKRRRGLA
jgi:hypothetical protein